MDRPFEGPTSNPSGLTWKQWLLDHDAADYLDKPQGSHLEELLWQPTTADCVAAWKLYTELRTRITTQPLPYRSGNEETALESVFKLFELSRTIIKESVGCTHFAMLTVQVLNTRIRPFTTAWHRKKLEGELSSADVRFHFRRELAVLQKHLHTFTRLLGHLANDPTADLMRFDNLPQSKLNQIPEMWKPLAFGITSARLNPAQLNEAEQEEILGRRRFYNTDNADVPIDAVGLAISGGGIRSATYALGVIQVLARKGILQSVDYMSTVSGGGYLGAFISSFLNDNHSCITLKPSPGALPFGKDQDRESQSVRHLRNHSKYLSEGGIRTIATILGMVIYGVLVTITLISPIVLTSVLVTSLVASENFRNEPETFALSLLTQRLVLGLGLAALTLPIVQQYVRHPRLARWWETLCICLGVTTLFAIFVEALPNIFHAIRVTIGFSSTLSCVLLLPIISGLLALWLGVSRWPGRISLNLITLTGPLLVLAVYFWLCDYFITGLHPRAMEWLTSLTILSWIYSTFFLNINLASPHRFYRNRLARTYLTRSNQDGSAVSTCDVQLLSQMNSLHKAPYHLVNTALNIPSCDDPNLRGRNTDFFLLSKRFCGSPIIGYMPTSAWESVDRHLDLGTAIAISAAAAAPHMGTLTSARYTFLLAMLNVRLGYWIRKPARANSTIAPFLRLFPPLGWYYFCRELTGWMSEKTAYLNVSDGGHIENLGVYELLRRKCKLIIAIDGEADANRSFGGLLKLTQMAYSDLGIKIEPDLADLRLSQEGHGRAHFALSRVEYPENEYGLLLYIKSSLTGNESEFIKKYQMDNPDFPHESTADQLFTETQFEAYRALGEHTAQDLFREDLIGQDTELTVKQWFRKLSETIL